MTKKLEVLKNRYILLLLVEELKYVLVLLEGHRALSHYFHPRSVVGEMCQKFRVIKNMINDQNFNFLLL